MKKGISQLNSTTYEIKVRQDWADKLHIEVGDSKQPEFYPQVKILNWDNEVNASFRLVDDESDVLFIYDDKGVIRYEKEKVIAEFYDIEPDENHPEGGYEFNVILNEKPKSNVVSFTMQTKGLDFSYQSELTQQKIDKGCVRPENVIGSYAVYHNGEFINYEGRRLYRSGKAFHIYRPKIIAQNGDWIWGELNIDEQAGILTITIDQNWLDNAVYPVIVDPVFGYTTMGASDAGVGSDDSDIGKFTLTENGDVTKITATVGTSVGTGNAKGLIFDDDGGAGEPDTNLGVGTVMPLTTAKQWLESTLSESLTSGNYYLGVVFDNDNGVYSYDDTGTNRYLSNYGYITLGDWDAASDNHFDEVHSYYATYTVGSTFGHHDTGTGNTTLWDPGYILGSLYNLSENGSVSKLTAHVKYSGSAADCKCVIYDSSFNLVALSNEVNVSNSTSAWIDFPLASAVPLVAGNYWLCLWSGTATEGIAFSRTSFGGTEAYEERSYTGGSPPDPWVPDADDDDNQWSIYATYTVSGAEIIGPFPTFFQQ